MLSREKAAHHDYNIKTSPTEPSWRTGTGDCTDIVSVNRGGVERGTIEMTEAIVKNGGRVWSYQTVGHGTSGAACRRCASRVGCELQKPAALAVDSRRLKRFAEKGQSRMCARALAGLRCLLPDYWAVTGQYRARAL